jgi:hypothetical protein
MPGFWDPPTRSDTQPRRRLLAEHNMDGLERQQPHIVASPPGTRAPTHLINYTPKTGEVHAPGVPAPEHELNYSLMPHDGIGAGADTPPGVGIPPGGENMTGRYANNANMRANTFSPGQPPLSPTPYGVGPGPRLQASGPAERPFEQRGTSIGNASTFGQDMGSFGGGFGAGQASGGMGAGQTKPNQDFTGTSGDLPDPNKGRVTVASSKPAASTSADAAGGTDPNTGKTSGAPVPNNLGPAPAGYIPQVVYTTDEQGNPQPSQVLWVPSPPGPGKKPIVAGFFIPGEQPDRISGLPRFQPMDAALRKELEGAGKDPTRSQITTVMGADGKPRLSLVDLDSGTEIKNLGPKPDESTANAPKREVPGDIKVQGTGSGQIALKAGPNGTWDYNDEWTQILRKQFAADEATKEQGATDRAKIAADATLATAGIYTVFTDASGQTWLLNENKGTREKIGDSDLSKGTMTVDNNVIKLSKGADGKTQADVVYSAGRNKKVDTINGKTVEYDERDPKGTWQEITEDKYHVPTEEQKLAKGAKDIEKTGADIEKTKADTAKVQADVLTGKISNVEAKAKLAKLAYDTLHPQATIYSTGDFYLPEGGEVDVHYMDEGTKRFGGKAPTGDRARLAEQINSYLAELDQIGKPAATTGGATTGGAASGGAAQPATTAAAPTATSTANQGDAGGGAAAAARPGWERADQTSGSTPKGNEQADSAGRTGVVGLDAPNSLGSKATPEQIEKAKRDWERQQQGLPPEEEEPAEEEGAEFVKDAVEGIGSQAAGWTPKAQAKAPARTAKPAEPYDFGKQAIEQAGLGGWGTPLPEPPPAPPYDFGAQAIGGAGLGGWGVPYQEEQNSQENQYGTGQDVNDDPMQGVKDAAGAVGQGALNTYDKATGGVRNLMTPVGEKASKLGTLWDADQVSPAWRAANIPNREWGVGRNIEQAVNAEPMFGGPGAKRVVEGMLNSNTINDALLDDAVKAGIGKEWWHNLPSLQTIPGKEMGNYGGEFLAKSGKALMNTFPSVGPDMIPQYVLDSTIDQFLQETGAADWRKDSPNYGKSLYGVGADSGSDLPEDPDRLKQFMDWWQNLQRGHMEDTQPPEITDEEFPPLQPGESDQMWEDLGLRKEDYMDRGGWDPPELNDPDALHDQRYGNLASDADLDEMYKSDRPVDPEEGWRDAQGNLVPPEEIERRRSSDALNPEGDDDRAHDAAENARTEDEWRELDRGPAMGAPSPLDRDMPPTDDLEKRKAEAAANWAEVHRKIAEEEAQRKPQLGPYRELKYPVDPNNTEPPGNQDKPYPLKPWDIPPSNPEGWQVEHGPDYLAEDPKDRANTTPVGQEPTGGHKPPVELPEIKAPDWLEDFLKKQSAGGHTGEGGYELPLSGGHRTPLPELPGGGHKPPIRLPGMPGISFGAGQDGGDDIFARLGQQLSEQNALGAGAEGDQPMQMPPADPNDPTGGMLPGIPPDIESLRASMGGAPGASATGAAPPPGGQAPGGMPGAPPPGGAPGGQPGWQPPVPEGDVAGIGHRFGQEMNQGEPFHSGVDLQALEGADTISPEDGIIEDVRNDPAGLGLTVIVRDKNGMQHKLGHLKDTRAYRGMVVAKGQNLAHVGSSGNTTGSHLHWAVRDQEGQPTDPTPALGPMGSLPPVPGTEMMGPPGGTGSPPGAAGGASSGSPMPPPNAPPMPGMGNDLGAGQDMGAGADDMGITPAQQAGINSERKKNDQEYEIRMAEIAQRREDAKWQHEDRLAKIESDFKIHQDEDRRLQEKQAEDARHNVQLEAIERERIQADKDIQAMKDATEIKVKQMEAGNAIYLQQGSQAFADWQQTQKARLDILGSALKNPWLQRLSGMTPGAGYNKAQVGGNNIQDLMNQILQPYDPSKWGAQNAPVSAGLGNTGATEAGGPAGGPQTNPGGAPYTQQQQAGGPQAAQQGGGYAGQNVAGVDWNTWQGWDPFQKAAYRTDTEALGPGAWEQVGGQLAEDFTASGGNENVTRMQAAGSGETGRAGMEMTADVLGQAPQQFWQNQNRGWSKSTAPGVKQNLTGSPQGY